MLEYDLGTNNLIYGATNIQFIVVVNDVRVSHIKCKTIIIQNLWIFLHLCLYICRYVYICCTFICSYVPRQVSVRVPMAGQFGTPGSAHPALLGRQRCRLQNKLYTYIVIIRTYIHLRN
jgi:hypothetical protein